MKKFWLHRWMRLLLPNVMDARVLSVLLFWLAMLVTSALAWTGLPRMDPADLWLPWWSGVAGIMSALILVSLMRRPSRKTLGHGVLAAGVGLLLHFVAAPLVGIHAIPPRAFGARSRVFGADTIVRIATNEWVLVSLMLVVCLAIQYLFFERSRGRERGTEGETGDGQLRGKWMTWSDRLLAVRPLIVRHRVGVMAGFVAVMMPLIVLRNIFDPESLSTPFLVYPAVAFAAIVGCILILPVIARLISRTGWSHWAFLVYLVVIVGLVIWSWDDFQRGLNRGKFEFGKKFAFASFLIMLLGTLIAGLAEGSMTRSRGRATKVSVISPLMVLLLLAGFCYCQRTYDSRVVAISFGQQPREFLEGDWIDLAERSRELLRLTDGAARYLPGPYMPVLEIQIRGEHDADVTNVLAKMPFVTTQNLVIRDVQPFVNLGQIATSFRSVRFIGGKLGSQQIGGTKGTFLGLSLQSVALPRDPGPGLVASQVEITSDRFVDGLADFLDGLGQGGARFISLGAPLTPADWESVVRNSPKAAIVISSMHLPEGAPLWYQVTASTDLSGIEVHGSGARATDLRLMKLAIQNGLHFGSSEVSLYKIDPSKQWAFLVTTPKTWNWIPRVPRGDQELSTYINDCRWAYGWDDDQNITDMWMPGMMLRADELAELPKLTTLRLDCRGFMEPVQPTSGSYFSLGKLIRLERLHLNDVSVDSIHFLSDLVNLKHLQIYAPELGANVAGSFAVCKSLETLRLFGAPIPSTVNQLTSLPNLRRVEVIDDRAELLNPAKVAKLRASLPGIEVVVTPTASYDPELSELFLQHRANVRRELMEWIDAEIAEQSRRNDNP